MDCCRLCPASINIGLIEPLKLKVTVSSFIALKASNINRPSKDIFNCFYLELHLSVASQNISDRSVRRNLNYVDSFTISKLTLLFAHSLANKLDRSTLVTFFVYLY